jgi:1,4-alpha-glucan branching enzyme
LNCWPKPPPQGFETLGFTRKDGKTIYREWAPGAKAAALIGDFNNWECAWMEKDEWGVWSVELPDGEQQQQQQLC